MDLENMNENIRLHLIKIRKNLGLSQAAVAARSEVLGLGKLLDQNAVVRIEKQPLAMDFIKLTAYLSALGISIEAFYELLHQYAYQNNSIKIRLRNEFEPKHYASVLAKVCEVKPLIEMLPKPTQEILNLDTLDLIEYSATKLKPIIGFFGISHVGKSTLINVLIGQSLLPTSVSATTRINTLLMPIRDKPNYLIGSVAVFKKGFHPYSIFDEKVVQHYLITQGDKSILSNLVHSQATGNIYPEAHLIVVFTEADVLNHVWLLDTVGDLENPSSSEMITSGAEWSSGVIFMSDSNDFLQSNEWTLIGNIMPLIHVISLDTSISHLLIVPSQCNCDANIDTVQKNAMETLIQIQEKFGSSWINDDCTQQLITRIQPFGREHHTLRHQTLLSIQELVNYLVPLYEKHLTYLIQNEITQLQSNVADVYQQLTIAKKQSDNNVNQINFLKENVSTATATVKEKFHLFCQTVDTKQREDLKTIKTYFDHITSQEAIADILNEIYSEVGTQVAQAEIGNYIGQLLITKITEVFNARKEEINSMLKEWNVLITDSFCIDIFFNSYQHSNLIESKNVDGIMLTNFIGFVVYRYVGGSWQSNLAKKTANVIRNSDMWITIEAMVLDFWKMIETKTKDEVERLVPLVNRKVSFYNFVVSTPEISEKNISITKEISELLDRG